MNKTIKLFTLLFLITFFAGTAKAALITNFELECTSCGRYGDFTLMWQTTSDATLAAGFVDWAPGLFFKVDIPELNGVFWAHTTSYGGGYNFSDNNFYVAMAPGNVIFDGPTSAPVWRVGVYEDIVNYFEPGTNQGFSRLTISNVSNAVDVPEPGSIGVLALGLMLLNLSRRVRFNHKA